ncbi:MAG: metal ABC transporter permease [Clostridia bacterium]
MNIVYTVLEKLIPFSFMEYDFMKNAFIAILIITPLLALIGTHIVNNKMAFFSDALGHSALTGIAIGAVFGITNINISMAIFGVVFALILNRLKKANIASTDTIISIFSSFAVALGLAMLSKGGNFGKYSTLLIGDILSIQLIEVLFIFILLILVIFFEVKYSNQMSAATINKTMAKSKNINVDLLDDIFGIITALTVMLSIKWVGILIINALLIVPAASSRNIARNMKEYLKYTVIFSVVSGILGLVISYYQDISTGPTIVIVASIIFSITYILRKRLRKGM